MTSASVPEMLRDMFMILAASTDAHTPTGPLVLLGALGAAALIYGLRWVFNVRGALDSTVQRRRALLELKGQQAGNLSLAANDIKGHGYFRVAGCIIAVSGLVLLALVAVLATA
jgi:hypothetical protein